MFGDVLARLLEFVGFKVTREYYVNDGGAQIDILVRTVYFRYLEKLEKLWSFLRSLIQEIILYQ